MYGQSERFIAACEELLKIQESVLEHELVWGIYLGEAPVDDFFNPGGPLFVIYAEQAGPVFDAQNRGQIPKVVETSLDTVQVVVVEESIVNHNAHIDHDDPMRPGSSIGPGDNGNPVNGAGTLGAQVSSPGNGDHIITAGHVFEKGKQCFQPGRGDRGPVLVGNEVTSGLPNVDASLVKIESQFSVDPNPWDSDEPSPDTPAIGLYQGRGKKNPNALFFWDLPTCLTAVGAGMRPRTCRGVWPLDLGRTVYASGRTSGPISAVVVQVNPGHSFICERRVGGTGGDSGAVCTIRQGPVVTHSNTGIKSEDQDRSDEWLPGAMPGLDSFLAGNGDGISINGKSVAQADGKNIISRVIAYLKKLGQLGLVVTGHAYDSPCRKVEADAIPRRRPTPCKVLILPLKEGEKVPEEPVDDEPVEGTGTCCTFGKKPYVSVSGEDKELKEFSLDIKGVTLKVFLLVEQTVLRGGATFKRYGACYTGVCQDETIEGTVTLQRKFKLELSIAVGKLKLPGIGVITAAGGGYKKESRTTVSKSIKIKCKKRKK